MNYMRGKITKIDQLKSSRNSGQAFTRVYFKVKRGIGDFIWAKTDIVPSFRNYARWKPFLEVGNILDGLNLKADNTVNADSHPVLVSKAEVEKVQEDKEQLSTAVDLQKPLF